MRVQIVITIISAIGILALFILFKRCKYKYEYKQNLNSINNAILGCFIILIMWLFAALSIILNISSEENITNIQYVEKYEDVNYSYNEETRCVEYINEDGIVQKEKGILRVVNNKQVEEGFYLADVTYEMKWLCINVTYNENRYVVVSGSL